MGVYASLQLSNGCGSLRGSHPTEPTPETSVNLTDRHCSPLQNVDTQVSIPPASKDANRFGAVVLGWSVSLTINAYKNKD